MYGIGPWMFTTPTTGFLGVVITALQVHSIWQTIVTATVRLIVATSMVVVQHFILSKQKTEKAHNQNPEN